MRRINHQALQALYEPAPQALSDGVREILSGFPDGKEEPIVKRKISISILVAALLAVMGVAALAVGGLNLFRQISERENPLVPLDGAERLVVTNLGQAENEHVALSVEEAVYDGQGVMVLVRLTPKDAARCAMYNPYWQDAPDDVYEKTLVNRRVGLGYTDMEGGDSAAIDIMNRRDHQEMLIDGKPVDIPADPESARASGSPVYMDGGILRMTGIEAMEVTGRKDGRAMIDYDLHLTLAGGTGSADFDGMLAEALFDPCRAEEQPDGSVLIWFNGYAETPMTDRLELSFYGETVLNGQSAALEGPRFALSAVEPERRFSLVPEPGEIDGVVRIKSATINLSKVRGYFTIEYEIPGDSPRDAVYFHVLDENGAPLTIGMAWAGCGEDGCSEQYEMQAIDAVPDVIVLEAVDPDGNVLGQIACRPEAE